MKENATSTPETPTRRKKALTVAVAAAISVASFTGIQALHSDNSVDRVATTSAEPTPETATMQTEKPKLTVNKLNSERAPINVEGIVAGDKVSCLSIAVVVDPNTTKIFKMSQNKEMLEVDAGNQKLRLNNPLVILTPEVGTSGLEFVDNSGDKYLVPTADNGNFADLNGNPINQQDLDSYQISGIVTGIDSEHGIGVSELIESPTPHSYDHSCGTVALV